MRVRVICSLRLLDCFRRVKTSADPKVHRSRAEPLSLDRVTDGMISPSPNRSQTNPCAEQRKRSPGHQARGIRERAGPARAQIRNGRSLQGKAIVSWLRIKLRLGSLDCEVLGQH
jgi:hypothetical protein